MHDSGVFRIMQMNGKKRFFVFNIFIFMSFCECTGLVFTSYILSLYQKKISSAVDGDELPLSQSMHSSVKKELYILLVCLGGERLKCNPPGKI